MAKCKSKYHDVYILFYRSKPVYVGCSNNVKNRISYHKKNKVFDSCKILSTHPSRKEALLAEKSVVKFVLTTEIDALDYNNQFFLPLRSISTNKGYMND